MDTSVYVTAGATLLGAVVGGVISAWTTKRALEHATRNLEATERRRLKVECLTNIGGLRFVMSQGASPPTEFKAKLAFELNRVLVLWADDAAAIKDVRDFYGDQTNDRFVKLFRSLAVTTNLQCDHLSDADLRNIFSLSFR